MSFCQHQEYKYYNTEERTFEKGFNNFRNNKENWKYDFAVGNEGYLPNTEYEQSILSQLVFINLVNSFKTNIKAEMFEPGLSIEVKKNDISKTFLFDVMHNPGKSCQPCQQASKLNYNNSKMEFEKIYHTIGNFAPVPRTIISKNYGPNLQQIHLQLNELWPWFLKFLKDNWEEFPTEVAEIMTFEEYMVFTCQQMYFSNIFESVYEKYNENPNECWKGIIQQTLEWNISKDDTLISFNELLKSNNIRNIEELDKRIMFLIELRGRCIMHLLQPKVTLDKKF